MKRINRSLILTASITALAAVMAGCQAAGSSVPATSTAAASASETSQAAVSEAETSLEELNATANDNSKDYDESSAEVITLTGNSGTVTIDRKGTYVITGSSSDGMIIVDVSKEDDVHLILRDVSLTSRTSAAIYVLSADEVYITLEGENELANGGTFEAIDENDIDAVIFSKDNLVINGDGTLAVNSPAGHGIAGKDDMVISGGTIGITAAEDGINTNDSFLITNADITVSAGDDAVHTDGLLQINGGTLDLTGAEGLEGTYIIINDGDITIEASDDGINAAQKSEDFFPTVEINGGEIAITMGPGDTDGIDSNGNLFINGGTVSISGQSSCDYDGTAELNGGTLIINGQQADSIPNQMMGGRGGMNPGMDGDMAGGMTPGMDGGMNGGMGPGRGGMGPR